MTSFDQLATGTGTVRLVFTSDAPFTLDELQTLVDQHSGAIEQIEHDARATVRAGDAPTVELSLAMDDVAHAGPACELEALAAVHDLEISLAAEGFALRGLRRAA
jgi:hypothetical protein